jgi:hypothetical protein
MSMNSTGGKMKRNGTAFFALAVCALFSRPALVSAQGATEDKPKAEAHIDRATPLKIQVVVTEFDGDKKVKSMPYVAYLNSYEGRGGSGRLRIGTRVPVFTGKDSGMQYLDVGTNIDCRATHAEAGSFHLELTVERSWVESDVSVAGEKAESSGQFKQPIIRQFKTEMGVSLRDGQSTESAAATDPLSGKVSKIEVTLWVVK